MRKYSSSYYFCDWTYSPEGSFFCSYGCEGTVWNYNEEGEIELTEFMLNFELAPFSAPAYTLWTD
jgi:hypothetical protein